MSLRLFQTLGLTALLAGCANQAAIMPGEVLDERTGMTVGALQEPLEFVESSQDAALANSKRSSFAYLGPIEWDQMGEITYGIWIHIAPGSDKQVGDIRAKDAVTLNLDDGPLVLSPIATPAEGHGPYKPVVSWGQTSYYALNPDMLKRMAMSRRFNLAFRALDESKVEFAPSHDTRGTLTQFARTRHITDD